MQVTVDLPDEFSRELISGTELSHQVLEALVLQKYLLEEISIGKAAEVLGLSHSEIIFFFKEHNAILPYTSEMLAQDRETLARLL